MLGRGLGWLFFLSLFLFAQNKYSSRFRTLYRLLFWLITIVIVLPFCFLVNNNILSRHTALVYNINVHISLGITMTNVFCYYTFCVVLFYIFYRLLHHNSLDHCLLPVFLGFCFLYLFFFLSPNHTQLCGDFHLNAML